MCTIVGLIRRSLRSSDKAYSIARVARKLLGQPASGFTLART
jgi:hypothetical protein